MSLTGRWFRRFATAVAFLLLAVALAAEAQREAKVARIGLLGITSRQVSLENLGAIRQGLRERGWVEGQNIVIEERWAEGKVERLGNVAAELVRLKVEVILALNQAAALAAKNATTTIPVVMIAGDDPVQSGLVASLARPGGNVTGLTSNVDLGITSKQVEMLAELVPNLSRVAVLTDPADPLTGSVLSEVERAARALRVRVQAVDVRAPDELERAFAAMTRERAGAVLVGRGGMFFLHRSRLATLAAKHKLPAMFIDRRWVEVGGLMSYGSDPLDLLRRVGTYVDKILKGAKPADLPIEQPTKFEFVINLRTVRALGLTIPPSLLLRVDQVIE
ncbi:MAG: ABC transporter substrate-binding protein [Thermoanaerobaculia bacterium]